MNDPTETARRVMVAEINTDPAAERAAAEARYGRVWNTDEVRAEFVVLSFFAPFVLVERISDGVRGTLTFQHNPRFYFQFVEGA